MELHPEMSNMVSKGVGRRASPRAACRKPSGSVARDRRRQMQHRHREQHTWIKPDFLQYQLLFIYPSRRQYMFFFVKLCRHVRDIIMSNVKKGKPFMF
jgi:hypothetical protein